MRLPMPVSVSAVFQNPHFGELNPAGAAQFRAAAAPDVIGKGALEKQVAREACHSLGRAEKRRAQDGRGR